MRHTRLGLVETRFKEDSWFCGTNQRAFLCHSSLFADDNGIQWMMCFALKELYFHICGTEVSCYCTDWFFKWLHSIFILLCFGYRIVFTSLHITFFVRLNYLLIIHFHVCLVHSIKCWLWWCMIWESIFLVSIFWWLENLQNATSKRLHLSQHSFPSAIVTALALTLKGLSLQVWNNSFQKLV